MDRTVITVDGLSGCGKSSISKLLASKCGFQLLTSGLLYRAGALLCLKKGISFEDEEACSRVVEEAGFSLELLSSKEEVFAKNANEINGLKTDPFNHIELYTGAVAAGASKIGAMEQCRVALIPVQREAFKGKGIVAEGRDMGTVVFPGAQVKFFINTPLEVRAKRRLEQIKGNALAQGEHNIAFDEILADLKARDDRDISRKIAPAIPAKDAIHIENGEFETLTGVVDKMYTIASQFLYKNKSGN